MPRDPERRVGGGKLLSGELVRPHPPPMLVEMIPVGGLEEREHAAGDGRAAAAAGGPVPGDLEVDQVRPAVGADENVFALFEVDVGDLAGVNGGDQLGQAREEVVGGAVVAREVVAVGVGVGEGAFSQTAGKGRNASQAVDERIQAGFVADHEAAEPCQGQSEQRGAAAELDDHAAGVALVEAGGGEEIVLEGSIQGERLSADRDFGRQRAFAEGIEPGGRAASRAVGMVAGRSVTVADLNVCPFHANLRWFELLPAFDALFARGGLVSEPAVPGGVIGDVDTVARRLVVEEALQLDEKVRVHQIRVLGEMTVQDAEDELQLLKVVGADNGFAAMLEAHAAPPVAGRGLRPAVRYMIVAWAAGWNAALLERAMHRYAGDFAGTCQVCEEYVEFALGVSPGNDPIAMHFGPGGPMPVEVDQLELGLMVEDTIDVRFRFVCPLCGGRSAGRATCRLVERRADDGGL